MHQSINPVTKDRKHFEDLEVGQSFALPSRKVTRQMIVDFARQYDPLPFHLDEKQAKASLLGGLASSGWQTATLSQKLLVDVFLSGVATMGMIDVTKLKWLKPVMVDDTIDGSARLTALKSAPDRADAGLAILDLHVHNQKQQPVLSMRLTYLVERRQPVQKAAS